MRALLLHLGIGYLIFCSLPTQAADLTKIERTIAKEPKYQGKPKYCLLVFGPEAKFRVWLPWKYSNSNSPMFLFW